MKYVKPLILNTASALSVIEMSENPKNGIYDDSESNFATVPGYSADE